MPAQLVLQAAAVAGPRIEPWLLTSMGLADTRAVDECLALGMLVGQSDVLAFRHELARQVVLETISPPRRVELHRQALQALRAPPTGRRDAAPPGAPRRGRPGLRCHTGARDGGRAPGRAGDGPP